LNRFCSDVIRDVIQFVPVNSAVLIVDDANNFAKSPLKLTYFSSDFHSSGERFSEAKANSANDGGDL
jgi:hypothetical protein